MALTMAVREELYRSPIAVREEVYRANRGQSGH